MNIERVSRSIEAHTQEDAPVIIAGGGLVGLCTAMFLAQHGVSSIAVERLRGGSPLPRAALFHMRTLEMFRSAGIEDDIIHQSKKEFVPEGALIIMDSIAGKKIADIIPILNDGVDAISPCRRLFVSQPGLEPILRRRAKEVGAQLLEGHEVVGIDQDPVGVTVSIRDVESGNERKLRGKYLVGADGAHSKVRELLDIEFDGRGVFSNSITIYFKADLSPWIGGKPLSIIYIRNSTLAGFFRMDRECKSGFLVVSTVGDPKSPDAANPAADIREERLKELVRAGIGVPDYPVTITGVARWRATSDVARRYQDGRIFLAGDAAHLMPPTGGFGGNTGIHDAHNLSWKLALVLKGIAGPELLSTYEAERKPAGKFTVEQAYSRYVTRTAPYLGAKDYEPVAHDFNIEVGYIYNSPTILTDGLLAKEHDDPRVSRGRPGSRAPHVWLEQRVSSIDLFDKSFVLLAGRDGDTWCEAARKVARRYEGFPFRAFCVGSAELKDPHDKFLDSYGITASGAVLVRPDAFVAWSAASLVPDPETTLARVFATVLAHPADQRERAGLLDAAKSERTPRYYIEGGFVHPAARTLSARRLFDYAASDPGGNMRPPAPAPADASGSRPGIVQFDYVWDYSASSSKDSEFDLARSGARTAAAGSTEPLKLYMHPISMTSRPVRLFIAENGIKVVEKIVDLMTGEHLKEPYTSLNPSQLVPLLEEGDFRLSESSAILKYLADRIGSPAYPRDLVKRAKIDEIMDWLNTQFYRDWGYALCYPQFLPHHKRPSEEAHAGTIEWGKQNAKKWLRLLNDHWIGPRNRFLCGNELTIADYFGAGLVTLGEVIRIDFSSYPNVARWLGDMKRLRTWEQVNKEFNELVRSTGSLKFETL